jgi:hypothetical protein
VNAVTADVNGRIAAWAPAHGVTIAHIRTGEGPGTLAWDPRLDSFDGLHPNATGQTLIAHRIVQALHVAGVLPSGPLGVYQQRVWAPAPVPTVAGEPGEILVGWRGVVQEIRVTHVRVLVDGIARTGWTGAGALSVSIPASPGVHLVQLVPRRSAMIGAAGPAVRVTVG